MCEVWNLATIVEKIEETPGKDISECWYPLDNDIH